MKIGTVFEISYAHRLMYHPGKCSGLHGHNGKVEVEIEGPVHAPSGMVLDFDRIKGTVRDWVMRHLDHVTILQEGDPLLESIGGRLVTMSHPPTAEMLAAAILKDGLYNLVYLNGGSATVRFWETSNCYAEASTKDGPDLGFPWYWDVK